MLTVAPLPGAGVASAYFVSLTSEKYYLEGGEAPGRWYGSGARQLQLRGAVTEATFLRLLEGEHPRLSKPLIQRQRAPRGKAVNKLTTEEVKPDKKSRAERVSGFDLTFSVPKSVSALWAVSDLKLRKGIERAIAKAVRETLTLAERQLPLARRGKGGAQQEQGSLVAALFPHTVSRAGEPQLHIHAVIVNAVLRDDETWGTLHSRTLFRWARTLGPLFRGQLARELLRLGMGCERRQAADKKRLQAFEISGVPQALCEKWSSRSQALQRLALGSSSDWMRALSPHLSAKVKQQANLLSRQAKQQLPPLHTLQAEWREVARSMGFDPRGLVGRQPGKRLSAAERETLFAQAWQAATQRVLENQAHFSRREIMKWIAEGLEPLGVAARWIFERTNKQLTRDHEIIPLKSERGEPQFTTRQVWEMEQALLARAERMQQGSGAAITKQQLQQVLDRNPQLSADQWQGVARLLADESQLKLLAGVAGSGKSFALQVVREAYVNAGYQVLGGALAAVAKEELERQSKIPSRTVASLLHRLEQGDRRTAAQYAGHCVKQWMRGFGRDREQVQLDAKTVLVLDEAAMIGTPMMHRLMERVEKAGATLILVGDDKQLTAVEGVSPFRTLREKFPHTELREHRRQQDPHDRQAVQDLRKGDIAAALKNYHERGRLAICGSRQQTLLKMIDAWKELGGAKHPRDCFIFTQTRAEADVLNRLCQAARHRLRPLQKIAGITIAGTRYIVGDRVLFQETLAGLGVVNGKQGTVRAINPLRQTITIQIDRPPRKLFEPARPSLVTLPKRALQRGDMALGYASTTHRLQGQTVKHALLLLGGALDSLEMVYSQGTRGKLSTRLFVDKLAAGKEWGDLIQSLERSSFRSMAHDLGKRNQERRIEHERRLEP